MSVLDASALLALLLDEPGAEAVQDALDDAVLSTVNLAEVLAKLADRGERAEELTDDLLSAGVRLEPLTVHDAEHSAALRRLDPARVLSLGDRCCLALGSRLDRPVLTADRSWAELALPMQVIVIR